jgi:hypothetical protein
MMILRPPVGDTEPESLPRRISARVREQARTLRDRLRSPGD